MTENDAEAVEIMEESQFLELRQVNVARGEWVVLPM